MSYSWNWGVLLETPYLGWILSGFYWTLVVSIFSWVIAFLLGSIVGIARTSKVRSLRALSTIYVEVFRNIPLLVQMFLWFFVLPEVVFVELGSWIKRDLPFPEMWTAVICLGTYTGARVAEQVRAGINSISIGQRNAALAIGLTPGQAYRYVLLPVAYRLIIPPLTSDFLGIFKNSSLGLTIGLLELTARTRQVSEYTFQSFEAFAAATALYVSVTYVVMKLMAVVEKRTAIPGLIALEAK
ncbi:amino acid ABC transporter permease [Terasakiella pusilla]|uniref:amino acid ABC transporter permease n=1 Tax=Terasakiella pusilla TaxID=64973 RepID=UPI003AA92B7C